MAKKRVAVPVLAVDRTRSPKDGLPQALKVSARRTARPLAESASNSKVGRACRRGRHAAGGD